jgi:hypothetical protein
VVGLVLGGMLVLSLEDVAAWSPCSFWLNVPYGRNALTMRSRRLPDTRHPADAGSASVTEPKTARLFEQVALVMGKIGLINGEAERQDHACRGRQRIRRSVLALPTQARRSKPRRRSSGRGAALRSIAVEGLDRTYAILGGERRTAW